MRPVGEEIECATKKVKGNENHCGPKVRAATLQLPREEVVQKILRLRF